MADAGLLTSLARSIVSVFGTARVASFFSGGWLAPQQQQEELEGLPPSCSEIGSNVMAREKLSTCTRSICVIGGIQLLHLTRREEKVPQKIIQSRVSTSEIWSSMPHLWLVSVRPKVSHNSIHNL